MSFSNLRKNRGNLDALKAEMDKLNKPAEDQGPDERFWTLKVDKAGNGSAVIRFLPAPGDETSPFVRYYQHGFQGPTGQYYIEKSLTSLGLPDPVSEMNKQLWDTGTKENQDLVRSRKRNLNYVSNIYVVKDPANPENEGKVFLYRYGAKIFTMIQDLMAPEFEGEEAINPFDLWEGANFNLRASNNGEGARKFRSYDKSKFGPQSQLLPKDEDLEKVWKMEYSLAELVAPSAFKSYDELKARLFKVLQLDQAGATEKTTTKSSKMKPAEDDDIPFDMETKSSASSDDDDLDIFRKLAAED